MFINFKNLQDKDLEILFEWANNEHVANWYKTPEDFKEFCKYYDQQAMAERGVLGYLVYLDEMPIGYAQYYVAEKSEKFKTMFGQPNKRVVGIDLFIGPKNYVGKGYGTTIVEKFVDKIFNDTNADAVIADPQAENLAAVGCFHKAGLKKAKRVVNNGVCFLYMEIDRLGRHNQKSYR